MPISIHPTDPRHPAVAGVILLAVDELNRRYNADPLDPEGEGTHLSTDELIAPHGQFFVARDENGHVVGGVALRRVLGLEDRAGEIKRLWVRPDQRRSGIALQLMRAAEQWAREHDFGVVYLETGWAQPEALALYERDGWERINAFPEGMFSHPNGYKFTRQL